MDTNALTFASEARVATASAPRYLGQLCKHFGHRLPVTYAEDYREGTVDFPFGRCALLADEATLIMRASAADAEDLQRLQGVLVSHLERFAFRETLAIDWRPA